MLAVLRMAGVPSDMMPYAEVPEWSLPEFWEVDS